MRYNLHTHTFRCRHAQGSDREYVEAAIKAGMKVLGFTDHCPQFFPTDYYSTFRMYPEEAADYAESVRALAKEYRDDIQILLGFETEYYPEIFGELLRLVRQLGCDMLACPGHKGLMGPMGTGLLYIKEPEALRPVISGGTGSAL